jgi:predicted ribosome quality control (RQC) complex YloA/Tae2 family protein
LEGVPSTWRAGSTTVMNLDGFNACALLAELKDLVVGSRLQKFSQLTEDDFLIHLRSPGRTDRLLVCLHPERSRFHLLFSARPPAIVPNSFVMLCRKHVGGTRVQKVEQCGLDRRLEIIFASGFSLVLDWAGRPSALLLIKTQQRSVVGAYPPRGRFRLRSEYSEEAGESSILSFSPSTAWETWCQQPTDGTIKQNLNALANDWAPLWRKRFAGLLQSDSVSDVTQDDFERAWQRVVFPLQKALLGSPEFTPALAPDGELTYSSEQAKFDTMNQAANARWASNSQAPGLSDFRDELLKKLKKHREKAVRKLKKREGDKRGAATAPQDQMKADLLLAYGTGIPRGKERFETTDWEGRPVTINLDPRLNSSANAERYYNRAKKKKRALKFLDQQIGFAKDEIEQWDELLYAAKSSENRTDLEQVRKSMPTSQGKKRKKLPQVPSSGPRRFDHQGFQILVGRNPAQNEKLSLKTAAKDDHWFHVRQGAGSHVLVRSAGTEPPSLTQEAAAWLAARFSQSSESRSVEVVTTRARFLKKPKGGPPGKVIYRQETEIVVDPTSPQPEGLNAQNKNGHSA